MTQITTKKKLNYKWSGVSYMPLCKKNCKCSKCGSVLHNEAGNHYCKSCDDYVKPTGIWHEAQ